MHDSYFESYADPSVHRLMIADHVRTDAFRRAIEAVVGPEDVVLDLGAGTGILSLFAARAGARHVYAVDNSSILDMAARLAKANGLEGRIEFIRGRSERIKLEQPVDVIVSEWLGYFALAECMFKSVIGARDRWLAPGGRMIVGLIVLDQDIPVSAKNCAVHPGGSSTSLTMRNGRGTSSEFSTTKSAKIGSTAQSPPPPSGAPLPARPNN